MYAKVENGIVVQGYLPVSGVLNGKSVSNYNLLPESILLAEGWLPLIEIKPEYDTDTQELSLVGYTIEATQVTSNYVVIAKVFTLEERIETQESTMGEIMEVILPSLMI